MQLTPEQQAYADDTGRADAMLWCIAYLMAEHCRREDDPAAKIARILGFARSVAADSDGRVDGLAHAPEHVRSMLRRQYEALHRTYSEIEQASLFVLEHRLPPLPPRLPGED